MFFLFWSDGCQPSVEITWSRCSTKGARNTDLPVLNLKPAGFSITSGQHSGWIDNLLNFYVWLVCHQCILQLQESCAICSLSTLTDVWCCRNTIGNSVYLNNHPIWVNTWTTTPFVLMATYFWNASVRGIWGHAWAMLSSVYSCTPFNDVKRSVWAHNSVFCCEPFVGPVGTAFCCALHGPRWHSLATTVNVHALTSLQDNPGKSGRWLLLVVLNPARTDFPLFLWTNWSFNIISDLETTDQSPLSGCLVASGC